MTSEPSNGNGRHVTRYEWDAHNRWAESVVADRTRLDERIEHRLDRMERNWDRYAGPVVVFLALLGIVATLASIMSAVVVLGRT